MLSFHHSWPIPWPIDALFQLTSTSQLTLTITVLYKSKKFLNAFYVDHLARIHALLYLTSLSRWMDRPTSVTSQYGLVLCINVLELI